MMVMSALIAGCSDDSAADVPTGTVQGAVMLDGQPVASGTIIFFGQKQGDSASSAIGADGSYTLQYNEGLSVPAGDYRVAFAAGNASTTPPDPTDLMNNPDKYKAAPAPVPDKFLNPETSGQIAVVKEGSNTINFDLKSN
jgi:hypothetical protein